ncbi:MAG: hypothetical protein ACI4DK_04320 [Lachnospiraceae bacterium]
MKYEQLSLFPIESNSNLNSELERNSENEKSVSTESEKILDSFETVSVPFLGCNFESVYPILASTIPEENTGFDKLGRDEGIVCEILSAAICHQMNWDYLREAIFKKAITNTAWLSPKGLLSITECEVEEMFELYPKRERIRAKERTEMLHKVGDWLAKYNCVDEIFLDNTGRLLSKEAVRRNILMCSVFSNDPEEKKMQLLLQKLTYQNYYKGLSKYYEPAIDYHLIRGYIRRGLLRAKNSFAKDYINKMHIERKESTTAAIRSMCADIMLDICRYTNLDICVVNQIEWYIGRTICLHDNPDCFLECQESNWLKSKFDKCPFFDTCIARNYNHQLLKINEPSYKGSSY